MACCALAAWLIALLARPFRALHGGPRPTRWAPPARWVPGAGASSPGAPREETLPRTTSTPGIGGRGPVAVLLLAGIVEVGAALLLALWLQSQGSGGSNGPGGHAVSGMASGGTLHSAGHSSHLVAMLVLELVTVAGPILVVRGGSRLLRRRARDEAPAVSAAVLLVAVAFPALLVVLHLPRLHASLAAGALGAWLWAAIAVAATAVWTVALSPVLPYRDTVRVASLVWTMETTSLLGLALLLAWRPIYSATTTMPWSAVTDQRLAGLLMMAVEAVTAVPVLAGLLRRTRQTADVNTADVNTAEVNTAQPRPG